MGLAAAKNKHKWGKDPNNTKWTRNTDTFGQRILRQQGWQPGQYLGAQDAQQAAFYGAANASHIRAVLKDDNLGLGARRAGGAGADECTGLDALQELLGRLNGRSEAALEGERRARADLAMNRYLHRKLGGGMRFVRGGWLVGDQMEEKDGDGGEAAGGVESEEKRVEDDEVDSGAEDAGGKGEKRSKKRRSEDDVESDDKSKSWHKDKKRKRRKEKESSTEDADSTPASEAKPQPEAQSEAAGEPSQDGTEAAETSTSDRKKSKAEKKHKHKHKKSSSKSKDEDVDDDSSEGHSKTKRRKKKERRDHEEEESSSGPTPSLSTATPTPSASGTSTPVSGISSRYLARKRFIEQKRAAVMDQEALKQIFMIKA